MGRIRNPRWQIKARSAAYDYPMLKRALEDLRQAKITTTLDAPRRSSDRSRSTENVALRELPADQMRRLLAVENALKITEDLISAEHRLRLIRMVYLAPYNRRRTICSAAAEIPCSKCTADTWNREFLLLVYSVLA